MTSTEFNPNDVYMYIEDGSNVSLVALFKHKPTSSWKKGRVVKGIRPANWVDDPAPGFPNLPIAVQKLDEQYDHVEHVTHSEFDNYLKLVP